MRFLVPSEGLRALQRAKSTMLNDTMPVMPATLRLFTLLSLQLHLLVAKYTDHVGDDLAPLER
ncbi:hypothetical protein Krac_0572 [Ktedonobacter racemifer DSM 44963]|uniref:Uncharacterized protein n=1 Tax=Ktedonobacter racemifer DSM 44963 TaxID=485913 RepID=D6U823_KTERA|nr:hypothetical protein Krac_0572 [Ktedonobacter racemifer DSM 44963]